MIKFKAWDKQNNEWYDDHSSELVISLDGKIRKCWNGELMTNITDRIELMLCSNKTDKFDNEIMDHSIVKYNDKLYLIKFDGTEFYAQSYLNTGQDNPNDFFGEGTYHACEVVGHAFENPELLDEVEDFERR